MYNIAIVEDQQTTIDSLKRFIKNYISEFEVPMNISVFHDGLDIVSEYNTDFDIIFMDIEMKNMSGMEAAKKIRKIDSNVIIIFVTNAAEYAIQGYHVNALSFLLKPITYFALSQELHKAIERIKDKKDKVISINMPDGLYRINTTQIKFIEVMKHMLTIHTVDKEVRFRGTMKELEKELLPYNFFRCNNCYLVNLARVKAIQGDYVIVQNHKLKISRPRKKAFMEALTLYIGGN